MQLIRPIDIIKCFIVSMNWAVFLLFGLYRWVCKQGIRSVTAGPATQSAPGLVGAVQRLSADHTCSSAQPSLCPATITTSCHAGQHSKIEHNEPAVIQPNITYKVELHHHHQQQQYTNCCV